MCWIGCVYDWGLKVYVDVSVGVGRGDIGGDVGRMEEGEEFDRI